VIPAYNESTRLPSTLEKLHAYLSNQPYAWEILVVANGCTDGTEEVARSISARIANLQVIAVAKRGKGLAVKTGTLASRGDIVFLCDADLSMPPEIIRLFIEQARAADVVAGTREGLGARRFGEPRRRHALGRAFNWIVQLLAVSGMNDTQCGFKAFRRHAAGDLFRLQRVPGFAFDVEVLYLARKRGYRIAELPIDWYFNADSRVRPGVDSVCMLLEVLQIRVQDALGRYVSKGEGALPSERPAA
jgi:glycosyltransferase involved in cell wall biosynthesis